MMSPTAARVTGSSKSAGAVGIGVGSDYQLFSSAAAVSEARRFCDSPTLVMPVVSTGRTSPRTVFRNSDED